MYYHRPENIPWGVAIDTPLVRATMATGAEFPQRIDARSAAKQGAIK